MRYSHEHKAKNHENILSMAARSFREHGGEVLGAFRPAAWANGTRAADEVQLLRIGSRDQIDAYMNDERRLALVPIRDRSIATTQIIMSEEVLER